MIASPVRTLARDVGHDADVAAIAAEVHERGAVEVVLGLPLSMDGTEGPAAARALEYAAKLVAALPGVPVRLVDERLSTVDAHRTLHAAGRREKQFRSVVDQVAAVVLLQGALDVERSSGRAPGRVVEPPSSRTHRPQRRKPRHGGGTPAPEPGEREADAPHGGSAPDAGTAPRPRPEATEGCR